jgi:hypothetical protein
VDARGEDEASRSSFALVAEISLASSSSVRCPNGRSGSRLNILITSSERTSRSSVFVPASASPTTGGPSNV